MIQFGFGSSLTAHTDNAFHGIATIDLLRDFIQECEALSPGFVDSTRAVALKAIKLPDAVMIRAAIQVLCVVETDEDIEVIKPLLKDATEEIRVDARCCLFERGIHGT